MNKLFRFLSLSKRQRFVLSVLILSIGLFTSEFLRGYSLIGAAVVLSALTSLFLYLSLREDIRDTFHYPIFILPILFTISFVTFYPLVPTRLLTRIFTTVLYSFGLYSLFLTQNIFAVSTIRTINLMRSARIVSFLLTILVLFFLSNVIFSLRLPLYISPILVFLVVFLLNFQSLWTYMLSREALSQSLYLSLLISIAITELSIVLNLWPVTAAIYSIFITGIFYAYSGLTHAWVEKRLFRNVLWEYVWVGFIAILILVVFSKWGL